MEDSISTDTTAARDFASRPTLDTPLAHGAELTRLGAGLALSAFYGLSLGARAGGNELVRNALGVPLGLAVLGAVMMPSLAVLFAILDAPVTPSRVLATLARGLSSVGLVLAGVAPGVALLAVTVESGELATFVARSGFVLAGALGLLQIGKSLVAELEHAVPSVAAKAHAVLLGYAVFAGMLAARLWSLFVPVLEGSS